MNTYLVTGGTGFISANLIREILAASPTSVIHVITQAAGNAWRLQEIQESIIIHKIRLDDHDAINTLIHKIKPTHIFHLAAYGGMPHEQDQATIFRINLDATINLINVCKQIGFACFIATGSSSEYGKKSHPMQENDLLEPLSDYGIAKAAATQFCLKEANMHRLPIYVIRPFSVYGPYETASRLFPTILINALINKPIFLGAPHNVRDFIYIDDLTKLYLMVAEQLPQNNHLFNGGSGIQYTIQDVVSTAEKIIGHPLTVAWGKHNPRLWEPTHWQADTTRAQEILGWQPSYSLEQGVRATMHWMQKHIYFYQH